MRRRIAVVGGGIAGIAAAVRIAEAGETPIVIETRRKLGGRATSFTDPRSGRVLDNCQHVVMGCCSNLLDLYERLDVLDRFEWHDTVWWANPPDEPSAMRIGRLPAPAHYAIAFRRLRFLSGGERRAIARGMWRMLRLGFSGRLRWRGRPFAEFLDETNQPPRARSHFWDAVVVSACNAPCATCDAAFAIHVFQEGFLASRWGPQVGVATVPLVELYDAAEAILAEAGGEVRLGVSAKGLSYDGSRVTGVVTDEEFVQASAVISAVPPDRLDRLVSAPLRAADHRLQRLGEFAFTPILGVHLFFDADVMETPHLVLPGRATQWLFRKARDERGLFHVHAVISAADEWMDLDESEIARRVVEDVAWALPRAKGLAPREVRSVKERRATFAAVPGVDAIRPTAAADARGGAPNLFLAGDWTDTGWPATMEGAARSGYAAAHACTGAAGVVADVPVGTFARWLGLR